tara:strand:- start:371 stop:682 length:312 start_codon:yes stop_codon:yes gene_type:complete
MDTDDQKSRDNILNLSDFRKESETRDMLGLSKKIYSFLLDNIQDEKDIESAAKLLILYARDMVELIYQNESDFVIRKAKINEIKKYLTSLLISDGVLLSDKDK